MTKLKRLGWRNFVSGILAVLVGSTPVVIYCLVAARFSYQSASTIGFAIAIALVFGTLIGAPLELFVVHRFKKAAVLKTIGTYLAAGAVIALALNLYWWAPALSQPDGGFNAYFFVALFLMIFVVYAIVAVIARLSYPLIHRLLWRVAVPYGSPVAAKSTEANYNGDEL